MGIHRYVTNPTKARKLKANQLEKQKNEIFLGENLRVKWLVEVMKSFKFLTFYKQYGSFLRGALELTSKEKKKRKKNPKEDASTLSIIKKTSLDD